MKRVLICDSGLGGLNIASNFFRKTDTAEPCRLIFFNAYPSHEIGFNKLPSSRDQEELFRDQLESMQRFSPDLCLIACNTLSIIWERLKERYIPAFPVAGILDAAVELMSEALNREPDSSLLILGTKTTAGSGFYSDRLIRNGFAPERIRNLACPGFATLLEKDPRSPEIPVRLAAYAEEALALFPEKPSRLILALCCTHFGFAGSLWEQVFSRVFGTQITVADPNTRMTIDCRAESFQYFSRIPFFPGEQEKMAAYFKGIAPEISGGLRNAVPDPGLFPFDPGKYGL